MVVFPLLSVQILQAQILWTSRFNFKETGGRVYFMGERKLEIVGSTYYGTVVSDEDAWYYGYMYCDRFWVQNRGAERQMFSRKQDGVYVLWLGLQLVR